MANYFDLLEIPTTETTELPKVNTNKKYLFKTLKRKMPHNKSTAKSTINLEAPKAPLRKYFTLYLLDLPKLLKFCLHYLNSRH